MNGKEERVRVIVGDIPGGRMRVLRSYEQINNRI